MQQDAIIRLMQAAGLDCSRMDAIQRFAGLLAQAQQEPPQVARHANAPSFELYEAVMSAPHEIDSLRVVLHYDDRQPGHNAANQLMRRLQACQAKQALAHSQARDGLRARIKELEDEFNRPPVAWMYQGVRVDGTPHDYQSLIWDPKHMDALSADKGVQAIPLVVGTLLSTGQKQLLVLNDERGVPASPRAVCVETTTPPVAWSTGLRRDRVTFTVGAQTFTLGYDPEDADGRVDFDQLEWMREQLERALARLAATGRSEPRLLPQDALRVAFANSYPQDAAILEQLEDHQGFMPGALGARHRWAAFEQGARAVTHTTCPGPIPSIDSAFIRKRARGAVCAKLSHLEHQALAQPMNINAQAHQARTTQQAYTLALARDAGFNDPDDRGPRWRAKINRLVILAQIEECEACARECDELAELNRTSPTDSMWQWGECAASLRVRAQRLREALLTESLT